MKAIIIDDEPDCVRLLSLQLKMYCPSVQVLAEYINPEEGLSFLRENAIDILFLDIEMTPINGFQLLEQLEDLPFALFFTTAYDKFAVKAFKYSAVDYLLKPFSLSRFLKACHKAKELFDLRSQSGEIKSAFIFVKDGYEQIKVLLEDILYIEASGNYTQIHLKDKRADYATRRSAHWWFRWCGRFS